MKENGYTRLGKIKQRAGIAFRTADARIEVAIKEKLGHVQDALKSLTTNNAKRAHEIAKEKRVEPIGPKEQSIPMVIGADIRNGMARTLVGFAIESEAPSN